MSVTGGEQQDPHDKKSELPHGSSLSRKEKRIKRRWNGILLVILLLPLWLFLAWYFSPKHEISLFIMDKTVPNKSFQEHRAFFWVLRNMKIVKPDGSFYTLTDDYYGFYPVEPGLSYFVEDLERYSEEAIDELADTIDMAVYLDGYGVYEMDWYGLDSRERENISPRIYGGITRNDIHFLRAMQEMKKPIYAEFSFLGSPTPHNVRLMIASSFNLRTTGWTGRYFDDLNRMNRDIPHWIFDLYQEQNDVIWELRGPGTVLVHEDGTIVILQGDKHLVTYWPVISTREFWQKKLRIPAEIRYPFWFEIVSAGPEYEMISEYYLDITEAGDSLLSKFNLPNAFPAVLYRKDPSPFMYCAGDFSDSRVSLRTAHLRGIQYFRSFFYKEGEPLDRDKFFWDSYINIVKFYLTYSLE